MQHESNVVASTTPAGGGDISPAPAGPATSPLYRSTAGATGVVEPLKPEASPAEAGSDEIKVRELFEWPIDEVAEDYPSTFAIDSRGHLTICTDCEGAVELSRADTRKLYDFLMNTARIWSA